MAEIFFRPMLTYSDEAHHVPADTYQKIMNYFTPKLWPGMTATPDKRDEYGEIDVLRISRYERDYSNTYADTDLVLYQKYTYEDVCRLLNWENNEVPLNIGGYKFDKKTKTFPVFINYDRVSRYSEL